VDELSGTGLVERGYAQGQSIMLSTKTLIGDYTPGLNERG
jgi:hypothetical protein